MLASRRALSSDVVAGSTRTPTDAAAALISAVSSIAAASTTTQTIDGSKPASSTARALRPDLGGGVTRRIDPRLNSGRERRVGTVIRALGA